MRVVVLAEQALDPCAACGEPCSEIDRFVRHDRQALLQRAMAVLIAAGRSQRFGAGEEELDALFARRALGEQAKRRLEPARSARGRAVCGCVAGLPGGLRRRRGRPAGRALDVVGARGCRRAARRERVGAALVRAEPPAARCRPRRPRGGRAGDGSESVSGRRLSRTRSRCSSSSSASNADRLAVEAAAAASSGSNGSPATAAPSSTSRAPSVRGERAPRSSPRRR